MNSIVKNFMFYITIVKHNNADHSFLRNVIHRVLPQALVDSVYNDDEAINYFNNCSIIPHLIFLDKDMLEISGRNTIGLIKRVGGLEKVPIIFLTNPESKFQKTTLAYAGEQAAGNFYSKPYEARDLLNIVGAVNNKWLA